jgi:hypothetical protein
MLMYVDEILNEIADIREYGLLVQAKFAEERERKQQSKELLVDARVLDNRLKSLQAMMPNGQIAGEPFRRTGWMMHWLEKGVLDSCRGDIDDLLERDLPAIEKQIKDWSNKLAYVDADLRREIAPLIRTRQFDSAIRKAFVVMKTRLCEKFGIEQTIDGPELVNRLFGKSSDYFPDMNAGTRQSYRDLFAGLFGLIRNEFAHNNAEPHLSDLDAVVANVNLCLRLIGDFRDKPTPPLR